MRTERRLPPIWIMGMTNAVFGLTGGFCAVIVPDLLAAHGLPAGQIASIAALILSPGFWAFLLAPMLDVRLSRRSYALIFGFFTALAVGITVAFPDRPVLIEVVMVPGFLAASLYQGAVGGWMSNLVSKRQDGELGIWFSVSNIGAGGLMMVLSRRGFASPPLSSSRAHPWWNHPPADDALCRTPRAGPGPPSGTRKLQSILARGRIFSQAA